ncbi:hypothetical protein NP233_g2428 [Leucocoprinus birnbaumii]|uniref:Uncharacterized protein n=1 Tax=Leucocoprinus birnbaumii TaxID=56174 RepID=A0AAD5YYU2_9AGAR|nr:hypothetical protein NP233_g2428 [Leucocoprinus birnbaumii]
MPPKKKQKLRKEEEETDTEDIKESARTHALEMKPQEIELDSLAKDYQQWNNGQEDAYKQWHKKYGTSARELGHSRSIKVDAASKMLNSASRERNGVLQEILKAARLEVDRNNEKAKEATDATALIRHYKNLLVRPPNETSKKR